MKRMSKQMHDDLVSHMGDVAMLRQQVDDAEAKYQDAQAAAREAFEQAMRDAWADSGLEGLIVDYEFALRSAHNAFTDAHCAAESWADERPDRWHSSEAGEAHSEWRDELESLADSLDPRWIEATSEGIEFDMPEIRTLDLNESDHGENVPRGPEDL